MLDVKFDVESLGLSPRSSTPLARRSEMPMMLLSNGQGGRVIGFASDRADSLPDPLSGTFLWGFSEC